MAAAAAAWVSKNSRYSNCNLVNADKDTKYHLARESPHGLTRVGEARVSGPECAVAWMVTRAVTAAVPATW